MKQLNVSCEPVSRGAALDRRFRQLVLERLSRAKEVTLKVHDPAGSVLLGEGGGASLCLEIKDLKVYRALVLGGSLGAVTTYQQGLWQCDDLVGLFRCLVRQIGTETRAERWVASMMGTPNRLRHLLRRNTRSGSKRNIRAHYDLGNEFFQLFLDPSLTYSSALFETAEATLEDASLAKLRRIANKLGLAPGMTVLEIGSGWGSFALLAAQEFGCHVVTTTLSREQHALATERVRRAGLENQVTVLLQDFRDLSGSFDRVVSIEMIEAIGHAQMPLFFERCSQLLKADGAMALQAITMPDHTYERYLRQVDVIRDQIFPGSSCPSRTAILEAASQSSDLRACHLEEIGLHYAETLRRWRAHFLASLPQAQAMGYDLPFLRLWDFYLAYCEAGFAERHIGDVQMVFVKPKCSLVPQVGPLPEAPYV